MVIAPETQSSNFDLSQLAHVEVHLSARTRSSIPCLDRDYHHCCALLSVIKACTCRTSRQGGCPAKRVGSRCVRWEHWALHPAENNLNKTTVCKLLPRHLDLQRRLKKSCVSVRSCLIVVKCQICIVLRRGQNFAESMQASGEAHTASRVKNVACVR